MTLSADMREVWKRLAGNVTIAAAAVAVVAVISEQQGWQIHGEIAPSAMQGCRE